MATASFERSFVVTDSDAIKQLHNDLQNPRKVTIVTRDRKADSEKGIELLKQQLSNSET
ncbi:hypothetical protein ISG33_11280 [Glaciecola sp. MH2013]|uniref:hypothetical protein n=1 Tax=Glaciecola sp. MH2013 TaxID=2785524 RepID=UPI00189E49FB|nr:hypothetical protein [Glaciecola sp. MH2013]MBF7073982.1 hypothetical protein [Glaciecola sp. MH2013]